jgi:hypothetical protein
MQVQEYMTQFVHRLRGTPAERKAAFDDFEFQLRHKLADKRRGNAFYLQCLNIIKDGAPEIAFNEFRARFFDLQHPKAQEKFSDDIFKALQESVAQKVEISPLELVMAEHRATGKQHFNHEEIVNTRPWWKAW